MSLFLLIEKRESQSLSFLYTFLRGQITLQHLLFTCSALLIRVQSDNIEELLETIFGSLQSIRDEEAQDLIVIYKKTTQLPPLPINRHIISIMTTTAGSPKFLEHADDGTRILNKRRQLFDIKVRCSVSLSSYFTRFSLPPLAELTTYFTFIFSISYPNRNATLQRRQSMIRNVRYQKRERQT